MRDSIPLGRMFGVRIGMNWSVLALLGLLVWTLSTNLFPDTNPGLGDASYVAMAAIAAVLFFASILLHELGHAVQARRDGMGIEGITLWLFGGVARFTGWFPSAGAEFRIAIAGPIVSLLLALGFGGAAFIPGLPSAVDGVTTWLGITNAVLLIFNLLPALPLDGGRMFRSAMWAWKGDFVAATRIASVLARIFAIGLIGLGLFMLFYASDTIGGAWMAIIGWFLLQAAGAESRAAIAHGQISSLTVGDLMVAQPVTARVEMSMGELADQIGNGARYASYPVVDDGRAVGMFPLSRFAEIPQPEWDARRVGEVMLPRDRVAVLNATELLAPAVDRLQTFSLPRALVVDGERLVGLLSVSDVARALQPQPQAPPT